MLNTTLILCQNHKLDLVYTLKAAASAAGDLLAAAYRPGHRGQRQQEEEAAAGQHRRRRGRGGQPQEIGVQRWWAEEGAESGQPSAAGRGKLQQPHPLQIFLLQLSRIFAMSLRTF